jgi:hypothetical protein
VEGGRLLEIVQSHKAEDVFNAETACFYKLLPDRNMAYKCEKCSGGRRLKERLSVLVYCNVM